MRYVLEEKYQELQRQEIYFPKPDELNDPVEGFMDVFWAGDGILWRNLFRHYLLCLIQAAYVCLVTGPGFTGVDLKINSLFCARASSRCAGDAHVRAHLRSLPL
jgi:hypothetical protein